MSKTKSFFSKLTKINSQDQEDNFNSLINQIASEAPLFPAEENLLPPEKPREEQEETWLDKDYEGQLAVDVYQTPEAVVIKSTIAGARPEDIEISINNDMVTIRGVRHEDQEQVGADYLYQECYWGGFSRSIILPVEVDQNKIEASLKSGILTVILPKTKRVRRTNIEIKEE